MMLRIFFCAYWPSVHLLWWAISSNSLPIFLIGLFVFFLLVLIFFMFCIQVLYQMCFSDVIQSVHVKSIWLRVSNRNLTAEKILLKAYLSFASIKDKKNVQPISIKWISLISESYIKAFFWYCSDEGQFLQLPCLNSDSLNYILAVWALVSSLTSLCLLCKQWYY